MTARTRPLWVALAVALGVGCAMTEENVTKPAVVIRSYRIEPSAVAPGQAITVITTYDLLTPKSVGPRR